MLLLPEYSCGNYFSSDRNIIGNSNYSIACMVILQSVGYLYVLFKVHLLSTAHDTHCTFYKQLHLLRILPLHLALLQVDALLQVEPCPSPAGGMRGAPL